MKLALRLLGSSFLPFALSLAGCAAEAGPDDAVLDDDADVAESDLTTACGLGSTCQASRKVLEARLFPADKRAPARRRAEVRIATSNDAFEAVPRIFAQRTTGTMTFAGAKRVLLSGSADGAAPIGIDDFLLVEVLGADGGLIAAGQLGGADAITVGGVAAKQLGTHTDFKVASIDIAPLLPKDGSFRLRFSGLDYAQRALVSDVYLVVADAPPPPAQVDLFDDAAFPAAPLSQADAVKLFPPGGARVDLGGFVMAQRTRTCNKVTGCGGWSASASVSMTGRSQEGTGGWYETPTTSEVPTGHVSGKTWLAIDNGHVIFGLKADQKIMTADKCAIDGSKGCTLKTLTTTCYWRADRTQSCYSYASDVESSPRMRIDLAVRVDGEQVRAKSALLPSTPNAAGTYTETQYVLYARTGGGNVTLAQEGASVFARF